MGGHKGGPYITALYVKFKIKFNQFLNITS
jgi:hypothetical protein